MLFSSVYVVLHFTAFSDMSITALPLSLYGYGIVLAIFCTILPTFMVMEGIKLLGANLGSIVASIGPVSTIFLGYIFLGETFTIQELIGSALVIVGVVLIGK